MIIRLKAKLKYYFKKRILLKFVKETGKNKILHHKITKAGIISKSQFAAGSRFIRKRIRLFFVFDSTHQKIPSHFCCSIKSGYP